MGIKDLAMSFMARARPLFKGLLASCLVLGIGGARHAWAQALANTPQIGILSFGPPPAVTDADPERGVRQGLRELGYVEGRNVSVVRRYADGKPDLQCQCQSARSGVQWLEDPVTALPPISIRPSTQTRTSISCDRRARQARPPARRRWGDWNEIAGHAHGILIDPVNGRPHGGSDPRSDGAAIGY